jgi:hypothetical protein
LTFDRREKVRKVLRKAFPEFPVFFGFDYIPELKACIENKTPYIFADHAYFGRGYENGNFRVIVSDIHQTKLKDYDQPRYKQLKVPNDWRESGEHILIFPPSATIAQTFEDARDWTDETYREIRRHTKRPIVIKRKQDGDLKNYLKNCHAAVGYATVASVEAVMCGVPVFCGAHCPASPVGLMDLERIDEPFTGGKRLWIASLSYSQFHLSEIENGFCREVLLGR